MPNDQISVVAALHPLKQEVVHAYAAPGKTLQELIEVLQPDPVLRTHAHCWIDDELIPREDWNSILPRKGQSIVIKLLPQGGGEDKNPLRVILTIAAIALSFTTFGASLGGFLGFGGTAAKVVGNTLLVVGSSVLINAIAPLKPSGQQQREEESRNYYIDNARNAARPFEAIPIVFGKQRAVPPLGAQTYTELVGDDQYLRMLVVWGYGPLKIRNIKIGETALSEFSEVQVETREGLATDDPLTLYVSDVSELPIGVLLEQSTGWVARTTTETEVDEISVDFTLPQGLGAYNEDGQRRSRSVTLDLAYRKVGDSDWLTPTLANTYLRSPPTEETFGFEEYGAARTWEDWNDNTTYGRFTITRSRTTPVREGARWRTPERAQYEVRVRRTTADSTDERTFDQIYWAVLRTFVDEPPITSRQPLAMTAMSIKATDQLNGVVDQLNAEVSAVIPDWDGTAWVDAETSNPASCFRWVLRGPARGKPLPETQINDTELQAFHAFCETNGFEFNEYRDYRSSVFTTLQDITAVGRASVHYSDGRWGIVIDSGTQPLTQHFTPRNSSNFVAQRHFIEVPHALRIPFSNREEGWRRDERIVYDDDYDATNAEKFQDVSFTGITDPEHIYKLGRFHLAQLQLRRESWSLDVGFEYLVATRGSRAKISHDILLVGLRAARITRVDTNSSDEITGIAIDETVTMEAETAYGVVVRTRSNQGVPVAVALDVGDTQELTFVAAQDEDSLAVGDLLTFGVRGRETIEGLVSRVEPRSDLAARLTLIPWGSPGVYTADTEDIPDYDTGLTTIQPPEVLVIVSVSSDFSASVPESGVWEPRIVVEVVPHSDTAATTFIEAQIRTHGIGERYYNATTESQTPEGIVLGDVEVGQSYDIRLRWQRLGQLAPASWTEHLNHTVTLDSLEISQPDTLSAVLGADRDLRLVWTITETGLSFFTGFVLQVRRRDTSSAPWSDWEALVITPKETRIYAYEIAFAASEYQYRIAGKGVGNRISDWRESNIISAPELEIEGGTVGAWFEQPVVEVPIRAHGPSIAAATEFSPTPATTVLVLIDGDERTNVTVEGTVTAAGAAVTLTGANADEFEVL